MADLIPEDMQLEMAACRHYLPFFIQKTFGIVTPGVPFSMNWHIDILGEYLMACQRREIKRLVINIPPRSLKSVSVSVAFPAWCLGQDPTMKFMCASYSEKLAFDLSMDTRRVMTDNWYKLCFPETALADDQNEKSKFATTKQGYRIATSVGGRATGMGGNCFPAGTLVKTDCGDVPIEVIAESPSSFLAVSYDLQLDSVVKRSIVASATREASELYEIHTSSGHSIRATPEHPIFDQIRGFVPASEIRIGDRLYCHNPVREQSSKNRFSFGMRPLQRWLSKTLIRNKKVPKERLRRKLLQQKMLHSILRAKSRKAMSYVQNRDRISRPKVLFRRLQKNQTLINKSGSSCWVSILRCWVHKKTLLSDVLYKRLCGYGAFCAYAGGGELKIFPSNQTSSIIQKNEKNDYGERWELLRRLFCCSRYKARREGKSCNSSHRRGYKAQRSKKSHNLMPAMPREAPYGGFSRVTSVRKYGSSPQRVYDIEVEGTHNFFAEGILVHNCLIVDDCHSPDEAMSDTIRDGHLRWFDNTWTSRLNNKNDDIMIIVAQRLHLYDICGHVLSQGGWEHLNLPAIFDSRKTFSMGRITKTVESGELLHPDRFSKAFLDNEKKKSSYGFSSQYLQNPVPEGGGIIKYDWFELWPAKQKLPRFAYVMQVWDTAFTEKTTGDPSACGTFGVFFPDEEIKDSIRQMGGGFVVMLIDYFSDHLGFPDLRSKMIEMHSYRYGDQEKAVDMILVEDKASGQSILQELKLAGLPMKAFKPGRMDKTSRLHSVSHFIENGMVYIPESTINAGKVRDWAQDFIDEVCSFPVAQHDEAVDILSSALITLSNMSFLRLEEMAEDIEEDDGTDPYANSNRSNPYGS